MGWLDSAIGAIAIIGGSLIKKSAAKDVAATAAETARREADEIRRANEAAQARYEEQRRLAAPGIALLRRTAAADPGVLTPGQQTGLEDARRQTIRGLSASGLRGAGRTTTAAIRDTEKQVRGGFFEANRGRSQDAANRLSLAGFEAGGNAAKVDVLQGRDLAKVEGDLGVNTADVQNAQGKNTASLVATLGSFIADEAKAKGRPGKYATKKTPQEA